LPPVADPIQSLQENLGALERTIRRNKARHVNSDATKRHAKEFIRRYFAEWRQAGVVQESKLSVLDEEMQALLRYTQKRTLVTDYLDGLRRIRRAASDLEVLALSAYSSAASVQVLGSREQVILETLRRMPLRWSLIRAGLRRPHRPRTQVLAWNCRRVQGSAA